LLYAQRWRCRPSEADEESAIWVMRQALYDSYRRTYDAPLPLDEDF
jgi:hypothetical protein